ncbi:MAG: hypothetical protein Q8N88_01870 [Nanoarchaeota archaeon]|nr:hypothetical protein [Nanoarchaeota archaeon]
MATKILAAQNRLFKNTFVCKVCKQKIRIESLKVISGKAKCRKCGGRDFRAVKKNK